MKAEELHPYGTYADIKLDDQSKKYLIELMDQLGIDKKVNPDDMHTTIIYSKKACPDAQVMHNMPAPFVGRITELKTWPTQDSKQCLVAIVECPLANRLHQHMRKQYSATHDYDEYIPHITLSYDCNGSYTLPDGDHPIRYTTLHVKPLDPDWKS